MVSIDHNVAMNAEKILPEKPQELSKEEMNNWFVSLIDNIKVDHFLLETDTASETKKDFYNALINRNDNKVFTDMRRASSQYFIQDLVVEYANEISAHRKPLKLALGISDSKILVWAEIEDDDEEMEDILLLSEAKVNGKYNLQGFYINSTIIEKSDNIPVPPHYQSIL